MTAQKMRFIFNKLRGDNNTVKLWEQFDSTQQRALLERVKLDVHEEPVVAINEGPSQILITTERITWRSGDASLDVCLGDIKSVKVPEFMECNKLELKQLWLITRAGNEYPLETQPGKPLLILWNLLIRITD